MKFRLNLIVALIVFVCHHTMAQEYSQQRQKKVLVLPYNPLYYLSDADHDIAASANFSMDKVHAMFNEESERKLCMALQQNFACISLLQDTTSEGHKDLFAMMGMLGYEYDNPVGIAEKVNAIKNITLKTPAANNDSRTAVSYMNEDEQRRYMKAVITKPEVYESIVKKYDADYTIFLTQMEIKTNLKVCIDVNKKVFERELILHFCVYNKDGKLVAGNFAHAFFNTANTTTGKIIGNLFPFISDIIKIKMQQL